MRILQEENQQEVEKTVNPLSTAAHLGVLSFQPRPK
jgi:hypothetical protein